MQRLIDDPFSEVIASRRPPIALYYNGILCVYIYINEYLCVCIHMKLVSGGTTKKMYHRVSGNHVHCVGMKTQDHQKTSETPRRLNPAQPGSMFVSIFVAQKLIAGLASDRFPF